MVVLNGFVKIHRKLMQWGWYQDNVVKGVFLHLLLMASYCEMPWRNITIMPGQVVTSYGRLSEDLGFTVRQVRTALEKLNSTGEITRETTNKYQLITIVNWRDYQTNDEIETNETTSELTGRCQANDRQMTGKRQHRKNIKKKRNKEINNNTRARAREFPDGISSAEEYEKIAAELRR